MQEPRGGGQLREQCDERYRALSRGSGRCMLPPRQHTIDMTAGSYSPTRYGVARNEPFTEWMSCIRRSRCPSFCRAATSRSTGLSTTRFHLLRRLPCDRNYSVPGPFHRFQHRSLSASQLQDETRVLPFCSSHWNHKRPQNHFPLSTQDPRQHVKVAPISLGKLGAHWRATP
jgi:hypothetical protein